MAIKVRASFACSCGQEVRGDSLQQRQRPKHRASSCVSTVSVQGFPNIQGEVKLYYFSGSDLLTCMLPTFCPPTIWAILEYRGEPSILETDNFFEACCRKATTPKKLWTLLVPQTYLSWSAFQVSQRYRTRCHPGPLTDAPRTPPKNKPKEAYLVTSPEGTLVLQSSCCEVHPRVCTGTVPGTAPSPSKMKKKKTYLVAGGKARLSGRHVWKTQKCAGC